MKQKSEIKNLALLFIAAIIWGSAFVAQSAGMDYVGPFTFLCVRSFLGFAFLMGYLGVSRKLSKEKGAPNYGNKKDIIAGGVLIGFVLLFDSGFQQIGMKYTSVGKAGFLTAMYVIFVPFINLVFFKKKLSGRIYFCVLLSVVGMGLLCLRLSGSSAIFELGDILELLCAISFSVHILVIDHYTDRVNPVVLSCVQFLSCGILSAIPMFLFEAPTIHTILNAWLPIAYAGIMSSGIAFTLQAVAQKNCDPTLASLVMCLESVFSAVFGWIILHQVMSPREIVGCALMFIAIVIVNLPQK